MRAPARRGAVISLLLALPWAAWGQAVGALRPPVRPGPGPETRIAAPGPSLFLTRGAVEIERVAQGLREKVRSVPVELAPGDRVHTRRKSGAAIRFRDGSEVLLGPFSVFTLEEETRARTGVRLEMGRLKAKVSKLKGRLFEVATPVAVAAVRGTEFMVEAASAKETLVAVSEGLVAVRGLGGDEALLGANQRVDVFEGQLGRVERFEGRPDAGRGEERRGSKDEDDRRKEESDEEDEGKGRKRAENGSHDGLRAELEREVGFQLGREAIESAAAFEMKNALYQEGKTLIDAFGQRVRVEEYVTRPDPSSFKFVTLNFREGRLDFGLFEVTANRELPDDLEQAGNLWFSPTASKPDFYAVRQRWILSNSQDSITEISVDGDSRPIEFLEEPQFDGGNFLGSRKITAHETVFGNVYEFINGDPGDLGKIWGETGPGAFRPNDAAGMMWHMRPIEIKVRNDVGNGVLATYYDYAFVTRDGAAGSTGKTFLDHFFSPEPFLAHFVERRHFFNFVDTNGNGIMDFAEATEAGDVFGVANIYHDRNARFNGTNADGTWGPLAAMPGAGCKGTNAGCLANAGDTTFFTDLNGNGLNDQGGATQVLGVAGPADPALFAFARNNPRDWLQADNFVIDDNGSVFDFRGLFANLSSGNSAEGKDQVSDLYERLNFERALTSSKFPGRKIDIVMSPGLFLDAGLLDPEPSHESVDSPGVN